MRSLTLVFAIACLIALITIPPQISVVGQEGEEKLEYVGARRCKMCHNKSSTGKIHDEWAESHHANAFELLKGDEKKNSECLKCHTTGYGEPGGFVSLEETKDMVGVQCEMCHGPGEKHIKSRKGNVIPNKGKPTEETCKKCHNDTNPNWDPERYTKPDGTKVGFYYEETVKQVDHSEALKAAKEK